MKWEKVELHTIVNNLDNKRKPLNDLERGKISSNGHYPYIGANNIMGYVNEFLFDETILCVAEDGGSWGPGQKCAVIYKGKTWVNNHAHVLTAKEILDLRYLMYYLNYSDLNKFVSGSTRGKLTKGSMEKIKIPLPPLHIQKQIADTLDKADALRRKDQQLLQKYDDLAQAIFYDMFGDPVKNEKGWEVKKLSEIAEIIMGQSPPGNTYNQHGEGDPLLNGPTEFGNLHPFEKQWTTSPTKFCLKDDILFCVRGATAGKMNIADKKYCIGRGLAAIRPYDNNMHSFIYLYLQNMYGIFQETSDGSTFINITSDKLKSLTIPLIPLNIVSKFSNASSNLAKAKSYSSLKKTNELFDRLLSDNFS